MWRDWRQPSQDDRTGVANWYRWFAEECEGQSPLYAGLSAGVAADGELLELIAGVAPKRRQPNLWFAATHYLAGTASYPADLGALRTMWLERADEMLAVVTSRATQTNEVGRCATLVPALPRGDEAIAMLEVGRSGGLCLLLDRYHYRYSDGVELGDAGSPVHLQCEVRPPGTPPNRDVMPNVVWRAGLDLSPVDVTDDDAVAWLQACVWPDQPHRQQRLAAAVAVARQDPPRLVTGDLVDDLAALADSAPTDATLVVFHSAVLPYVRLERQRAFVDVLRSIAARRPLVWVANEGPGVVAGILGEDGSAAPSAPMFSLTVNDCVSVVTSRPVAHTHPHGAWIEWLEDS